MSIPDKINKIINKHGKVADFDGSKILNSIIAAIIDVERANRWIAERRARKYYDAVYRKAYDRFYNLEWLLEDLFRKYINFAPAERLRRLENAFVSDRLAVVLREEFKSRSGSSAPAEGGLRGFILNLIEKSALEEKYTTGLFPPVSDTEKSEIIDFLTRKAESISKAALSDADMYPTREYLMDMIEEALKEIGEVELTESFMIFREGKNKVRSGEISEEQFTNNGIHYQMSQRTLEWNIENECESLFALNGWVNNRNGKDIRTLIELSDKRYVDNVQEAIGRILERINDIKIIVIAGPSCSNKTTTTVIIEQELSKIGLKLKQLNVDDYFKNLEDQPKDEFGDYDFEMPEAIDMELLNGHLGSLLSGSAIQKPCYNFKNGRRESSVEFFLKPDEILLIDCLHGLYRKLTCAVPAANKFRIYIESMNILRNSEGG